MEKGDPEVGRSNEYRVEVEVEYMRAAEAEGEGEGWFVLLRRAY